MYVSELYVSLNMDPSGYVQGTETAIRSSTKFKNEVNELDWANGKTAKGIRNLGTTASLLAMDLALVSPELQGMSTQVASVAAVSLTVGPVIKSIGYAHREIIPAIKATTAALAIEQYAAMGLVAGIAVGVGITVYEAWNKAQEGADSYKKTVDALKGSLDGLNLQQDAYNTLLKEAEDRQKGIESTIKDLKTQYDDLTDIMKDALDIGDTDTYSKAKATRDQITSEQNKANDENKRAQDEVNRLKEQELKVTQQIAEINFRSALFDMQSKGMALTPDELKALEDIPWMKKVLDTIPKTVKGKPDLAGVVEGYMTPIAPGESLTGHMASAISPQYINPLFAGGAIPSGSSGLTTGMTPEYAKDTLRHNINVGDLHLATTPTPATPPLIVNNYQTQKMNDRFTGPVLNIGTVEIKGEGSVKAGDGWLTYSLTQPGMQP